MKRSTSIRILILVIIVLVLGGSWLYNNYTSLQGLVESESPIKESQLDIKPPKVKYQDGDIIFQTSQSNQSKAIQLAIHSKYSHMGIIFIKEGKTFVYEAVQPVKYTPLSQWIKRGKNNHFVVKRLKNADEILTPEIIRELHSIGQQYIGKKYDIYFEWSDERIYCSELVWKIYKEACNIEIGKLEELSDFDLSSDIVMKKMKERYGENIPLDELVISPAAMFESDKLVIVTKN